MSDTAELKDLLRWDGAHVTPDDEQMKKIYRPYLSPSSSSSFHRCPARLIAERTLPEIVDPYAPAPLGNNAHTVLENLYNLPVARRTKREARRLLRELGAEVWPDPTARLDRLIWFSMVWTRVIGIWKLEDPTKVLVRRTEWRFDNFEIGKSRTPFTGIIDRIDITGDEYRTGCSVIDYKSGKARFPRNGEIDDYTRQIHMYAMALNEHDGRAPMSGALYYTAHSQAKVRKVSISTEAVANTDAWLGVVWNEWNEANTTRRFAATPNRFCDWCVISAVCPAVNKPTIPEPPVEELPFSRLPLLNQRIPERL